MVDVDPSSLACLWIDIGAEPVLEIEESGAGAHGIDGVELVVTAPGWKLRYPCGLERSLDEPPPEVLSRALGLSELLISEWIGGSHTVLYAARVRAA